MEVSKVSSLQSQNFNGNSKTEEKQAKTPEQVKEGKKKLALALAGLSAAALAGVAIYKGRQNKAVEAAAQNANKALSKAEEALSGAEKTIQKASEPTLNTLEKTNEIVATAVQKPAEAIQEAAEVSEKKLTGLVKAADGSYKSFDKNGVLRFEKTADGEKLWYDGSGKLTVGSPSRGCYQKYSPKNNQKVVAEVRPDSYCVGLLKDDGKRKSKFMIAPEKYCNEETEGVFFVRGSNTEGMIKETTDKIWHEGQKSIPERVDETLKIYRKLNQDHVRSKFQNKAN